MAIGNAHFAVDYGLCTMSQSTVATLDNHTLISSVNKLKNMFSSSRYGIVENYKGIEVHYDGREFICNVADRRIRNYDLGMLHREINYILQELEIRNFRLGDWGYNQVYPMMPYDGGEERKRKEKEKKELEEKRIKEQNEEKQLKDLISYYYTKTI